MQIDLLTKIILPLSLFFIMFGMGLSLRATDFKAVFKFPKAVSIGLAGQMLLLPVVAFLLAILFDLQSELAVGLIILALAPGGATSNMFSYLFEGDVALSITLTAIVGLIAPFTIPLVAALSMDYFIGGGQSFEFPIVKTIGQLLIITVIPVILGMLVLATWPKISSTIEKYLKWFSVIFMFVVIGLIGWTNSDKLAQFFVDVGLSTLALNLSVLTMGFLIAKWARLSKQQAITIGFEIGIQNGTLALVVAGTLIGNSTMMIPALVYGLLMFVTGAIFGWLVTRTKDRSALQEVTES